MATADAPAVPIEFISHLPGMDGLAAPVPANRARPAWFHQAPVDIPGHTGQFGLPLRGMKACPGITDYLSLGVIIPAWTDMLVRRQVDEEGDRYADTTALTTDEVRVTSCAAHSLQMPTEGTASRYALKLDSPWVVRTPPGWSVLILPLAYGRHHDFEVFPGVVDTDVMHQMHFIGRLNFEGERLIELGTPLLQVIPFERQRVDVTATHDADLHAALYGRGQGAPGSGQRMKLGGYRAWRRVFRERHGVQ
jgi:hypothetical protein